MDDFLLSTRKDCNSKLSMKNLQPITVPWEKIDTVLLDMDGTLLDLHFDNYFWVDYIPRVYSESTGISLTESQKLVEGFADEVMGTLKWYCLDYWSEKLDLDIPQLKNKIADKIKFRTNAEKFLQSLNDKNKQVILATNAHPKALELKILRADFRVYFDHLSSSHDLGYPKEEQEYWQILTSRYSLNPSRCLFIDDSVRILSSAQNFGIGYLLGIPQPDSQKKACDCTPFTGISNFSQLL